MASRRSSPDAPSPRAKRSKISNACDACQRRKSRCELVNDAGCHRCRILRTQCSLSGQDTVNGSFETTSAPAHTTFSGDQLPQALDRLTATIEGLVRKCGSAEMGLPRVPAAGSVTTARNTAETTARHGDFDRTTESSSAIAARALGLHVHPRLADPVALGVVSMGVLVEACHVAKAALRTVICPQLTDDLLDATRRCSFLSGCILHYASIVSPSLFTPSQVRHLSAITQANLTSVPFAKPTVDMVLGLLVMSLSPSEGDERDLGVVDVKDAAVRALAMARRLGLDDVAWSWDAEDTHDLEMDWKLPKLHKLMLWYCVLHRHQWVEIFSSASCSTSVVRYPFTLLFSHPQALATGHASIIHLAYEASLLSMVESLSAPLQACRLARTFDDSRAENLIQDYTLCLATLEEWRRDVAHTNVPTSDFLHINSLHLQTALSIKMSTEAAALVPTPLLVCNRLRLIMDFGSKMLHGAADLAVFHSQRPFELRILPAFNLTLTFLAFASLDQSGKLRRDVDEDDSHPATVYETEIAALRTKLLAAHAAGPNIMRSLDRGAPDPAWREFTKEDRERRLLSETLEYNGGGQDFIWPLTSSYDFLSFLDVAPIEGGLPQSQTWPA